jgi:protocatechuate 4,5-dioxygenase beta chain
MPLVLGLTSSHAPSMFTPPDKWPEVHRGLTRGLPQPPELEDETPQVIESYVARIKNGLATLRQQLEVARPDALLIVGDDQSEVFSRAINPSMAVFLGDQVSGTTSISWIGERREENHVTLRCHAPLAREVANGLVARGFDVACSEELHPLARPEGGLGHAFTRLGRALGLHESGLPTIIFFLNAYHPPLPSAARCYDLGRALAEIFARRPERVAILGSGGLSHCPLGPRAGWVDEPLDHWVLDRIASGEGEELRNLFTFDSDTLRGGTGEIRSWITVAGAFHAQPATVVDYLPARHAVTGLGFAHWNAA